MYNLIQIHGDFSRESEFNRALNKEYRKNGWIVHKIADTGLGGRFVDNIMVSPDGTPMFLELKVIPGDTFNMSRFEDNQRYIMDSAILRDPSYWYVGIYSKKRKRSWIIRYDKLKQMCSDKGNCIITTQDSWLT